MVFSLATIVKCVMFIQRYKKIYHKNNIWHSNIVCTSNIEIEGGRNEVIDIKRIARKSLNCIYDMSNGPPVNFRFTNPIMSAAVYDTGNINHCGGHNLYQKKKRIIEFVSELQTKIPNCVIKESIPITVVNILSPIRMPYNIDMNALADENPDIASYIKENFTGCTLTLHTENKEDTSKIRKISAVIFPTGAVNLIGCVDKKEYLKYIRKLRIFLANYKDEN